MTQYLLIQAPIKRWSLLEQYGGGCSIDRGSQHKKISIDKLYINYSAFYIDNIKHEMLLALPS